VEPVRDRRARRTPRRVVGAEHEVVNEELRASSEEISEGRFSFVGLEAVLLVDPNPRQLLPSPGQLVAAPGQFLLGLEQLQPCRKPLFACPGLMISHRFLSSHLVGHRLSLSSCCIRLRQNYGLTSPPSLKFRRDRRMRSVISLDSSARRGG